MKGMYSEERMMSYFDRFAAVRALIVGAGAVGTCLAEHLAKMGVGRITLVDMDRFTLENAAKHAGMIRTPEDVGAKKAPAAAKRAGVLMTEGGEANGIDAEIALIGPWALAGYDFVFAALDNYAAKLYLNRIWLEVPAERRPVLIQGGTIGEMAQANVLDGTGACWRCLCDESWFADSLRRTSCSGPQYRMEEGEQVPVRTSGLASDMAAHLMAEEMRAIVLGLTPEKNRRVFYSAWPNFGLESAVPMRRKSCPDCAGERAPREVIPLEGSVLTLSLGEALAGIGKVLGTEKFTLGAHVFSYAGAGYGGVIVQDTCKCCGAPLPEGFSHEGRTRLSRQICADCRKAGKQPRAGAGGEPGLVLGGFSPADTPERLMGASLFSLGWPLGGYLKVRTEGGLDALDEGTQSFCFVCSGDEALMKQDLTLAESGADETEE